MSLKIIRRYWMMNIVFRPAKVHAANQVPTVLLNANHQLFRGNFDQIHPNRQLIIASHLEQRHQVNHNSSNESLFRECRLSWASARARWVCVTLVLGLFQHFICLVDRATLVISIVVITVFVTASSFLAAFIVYYLLIAAQLFVLLSSMMGNEEKISRSRRRTNSKY